MIPSPPGEWDLLASGIGGGEPIPQPPPPVPLVLQLRDTVSVRECSLLLAPEDIGLTLGGLLERYLRQADIDRMLAEGRMTASSAGSLFAIQDLVYASNDSGRLSDMFDGVAFTDAGRPIGLNDVPSVHHLPFPSPSGGEPEPAPSSLKGWGCSSPHEIALLDIGIDRIACGYDRNWRGFHARKWQRAPRRYESFVRDSLVALNGEAGAEELLELSGTGRKLGFLESLARRVWDSPFENYSRFTRRRLVYKSGDETIDNILDGGGAICSEKVQALKFLTDHYGLESEYLIAGPDADGPVPVDKLREILRTFNHSFAMRHMRYWQHTALLYLVDGVEVLVDATNGNVPFLFLTGDDCEALLRSERKRPVPVRMVEAQEDFYYHRVPQDIPENLFFALEGWMTYSDLMQVFDNELGLFLSADYYVAPIAYRSDGAFRREREQFLAICRRGQLRYSITREWTLDTELGREFAGAEPEVANRIMAAREHLLRRLDQCDGPGHDVGLAIIELVA